ncbi:MAG: hypothetical protein R2941_19420 [Desulfobacterales bacterium]
MGGICGFGICPVAADAAYHPAPGHQRILPALAGQFISVIKDSSIVSVISIQELTFQGMELVASTYLAFEIWITVTVLYLVLTLSCSLIVERFELHLRRNR